MTSPKCAVSPGRCRTRRRTMRSPDSSIAASSSGAWRRRSKAATVAMASTCCVILTSIDSRSSTTAAVTSPGTACCARSPSCCATRYATATRSGVSAVTSSARCWSAVRWTRPGRSPMTSPDRWASTASCGRTRSSTSASRWAWWRSRARAARWKSCWPPPIPPATSPRSRVRDGWWCTRRAMRRWRATRARSSGCSACRVRSRKTASTCTSR